MLVIHVSYSRSNNAGQFYATISVLDVEPGSDPPKRSITLKSGRRRLVQQWPHLFCEGSWKGPEYRKAAAEASALVASDPETALCRRAGVTAPPQWNYGRGGPRAKLTRRVGRLKTTPKL